MNLRTNFLQTYPSGPNLQQQQKTLNGILEGPAEVDGEGGQRKTILTGTDKISKKKTQSDFALIEITQSLIQQTGMTDWKDTERKQIMKKEGIREERNAK